MAFVSGTLRSRADIVSDTAFHNTLQIPSDRTTEWSGAETSPPRGSRGHVIALVAALSALAVYVGGRELIQATVGSVPLIDAALIGLSVLILMSVAAWRLALRDVLRAGSDESAPADDPLPAPDRFAPLDGALQRRQREPFFSAPPRVFANPEFRQRFGTYAPHAQAELANYPRLAADLNGNSVNSPVVERLAAALETMAARREGPVLNRAPRQDATALRVPASEATLPPAIAELAAKATACAPQLELQLSVPEIQQAAAMRESFLPNSVETSDAIAFTPPRILQRMMDRGPEAR
jgi:hypothetical protein